MTTQETKTPDTGTGAKAPAAPEVNIGGRVIRLKLTPARARRFERLAGKRLFGSSGFDIESVLDLTHFLLACVGPAEDASFAKLDFTGLDFTSSANEEIRNGIPLEEKALLRVQLSVLEALHQARGTQIPPEALADIRRQIDGLPAAADPANPPATDVPAVPDGADAPQATPVPAETAEKS